MIFDPPLKEWQLKALIRDFEGPLPKVGEDVAIPKTIQERYKEPADSVLPPYRVHKRIS